MEDIISQFESEGVDQYDAGIHYPLYLHMTPLSSPDGRADSSERWHQHFAMFYYFIVLSGLPMLDFVLFIALSVSNRI